MSVNTPSTSESFRATFVATGDIQQASAAFFKEHAHKHRDSLLQAVQQLKVDLLANPGPWLAAGSTAAKPALSLDAMFTLSNAYGKAAGGSAPCFNQIAQMLLNDQAPVHGRTLGEAAAALGLRQATPAPTTTQSSDFRPRRRQDP